MNELSVAERGTGQPLRFFSFCLDRFKGVRSKILVSNCELKVTRLDAKTIFEDLQRTHEGLLDPGGEVGLKGGRRPVSRGEVLPRGYGIPSAPFPPLADPDGLGGEEVQDLHRLEVGILELSEGLAEGRLGCLLIHLRI